MKPPHEKIARAECRDEGYHFNVGDQFYVQYTRHGSVGIDAEIEVTGDGVVEVERREAEYLHPERLKPGWTGGDKEHVRWFFRAIGPGTARIIVRRLFRFEVESECTIRAIVK